MVSSRLFSYSFFSNQITQYFLRKDNLYFHLLPILLFSISLICIIILLLLFGLKVYYLYKKIKEESILLEITPPSNADQSSYSTEQLFTTLHSLGSQISSLQGLLGKKKQYSLELVSTKNEGIRFLLRTNSYDAPIIERNISAYLPGVTIKKTTDYLTGIKENFNKSSKIVELRLTKNFVLPLQKQSVLSEHDPIAYITSHMTKMLDEELISFQIILTPLINKTHKKQTQKIHEISEYIAKGLDISAKVRNTASSLPVLSGFFSIFKFGINSIVFCILSPFTLFSSFIYGGKSEMLPLWLFTPPQPKKQILSERQLHLHKIVGEKIGEELFETTIRIVIRQNTKATMQERLNGLLSTFSFYTNAGYQSLVAKRSYPIISRVGLFQNISYFLMNYRLLSFSQNPILSVSELSAIFHLPYFPTTKTEDMVKRRSMVLPAPLYLKQSATNLDIIFAKNDYGNKETMIGLTAKERYRHIYINGKTGTGKTTLLANMIHQDIQNGKGLAVIDPHGELIQMILGTIPKHRIKDVIYFNPRDRDLPIGLNILELPQNLTEDQLDYEKDIIISSIISIFHKIYDEKYLGPRMENILRFTILTALETDQPTLFTINKLLTDDRYRATIIKTLKDPVVKDFWVHEFKKHGSFQQSDMTSPITNKLGQFLSSSLCRNILGQKHSTIDFEDILNNGKILLCNIPKGGIGEDNSKFFGTLIAAKIQLAALKREKIPQSERRDFYLYIDEFQNFAMPSFAQMMSESRKYKVYGVWAHQTIAQLKDHDLTKIILANTGTVICFPTSSPFDEESLLPIFAPLVKEGDLMNLPSFSFYIKINALEPYDAFSGKVEPFPYTPDETIAQEIIKYSRETYGTPKQQVKEEIESLFAKQAKDERVVKAKSKEEKKEKKIGEEKAGKPAKETKKKAPMDNK